MRYMCKESMIRVDGVEIHVYNDAPSPIYPFWHRFLAAFCVYEFARHRLHITYLDCYKLINGKQKKVFKRK